MFYEEIRIKQGHSYISIIMSIKDSLQQQIHLMATSLRTNAVIVTRVHCTVELNGSNPDGSFTMDESNTFLSPQGFPPKTIYG